MKCVVKTCDKFFNNYYRSVLYKIYNSPLKKLNIFKKITYKVHNYYKAIIFLFFYIICYPIINR